MGINNIVFGVFLLEQVQVFLDDGIRFCRFVKADETLTDRRQKRKIQFSLNWFCIRLLLSAMVRGILSKQMFNRYVYEFMHL